MKKDNGIIFISFGKDEIHKQTLFSVFSLIGSDISYQFNILIFTDNIIFFKKYLNNTIDFEYFYLNESLIKEWRGSFKFPLRIKIIAIKYALEFYYQKIIFIDSDTFFIKPPIQLFESITRTNTILYIAEGQIYNRAFTNWEILRNNFSENRYTLNELEFRITDDYYMWNSGVVGLSKDHLCLVEDALTLTDQYCVLNNSWHPYLEQIMFSISLARKTKIQSSDKYITHYCYGSNKAHMNILLRKFYKDINKLNSAQILQIVSEIIKKPIPDGPIPQSILERILTSISKRKIGLSMAINRVRKTKNIYAFFHRGKDYLKPS